MNTTKIMVMSALCLAAVTAAALATPPKAKISPKQAEAAATKKVHGHAAPATYEFEDGHWQYAVVVTNAKGMYEVEVNATSGKVTDVEKTSAGEEAAEAKQDAKSGKKAM